MSRNSPVRLANVVLLASALWKVMRSASVVKFCASGVCAMTKTVSPSSEVNV